MRVLVKFTKYGNALTHERVTDVHVSDYGVVIRLEDDNGNEAEYDYPNNVVRSVEVDRIE